MDYCRTLDRKKTREYLKRGKSVKYKELDNQCKEKYQIEAEKYLRRNMRSFCIETQCTFLTPTILYYFLNVL